jgi:hypothetical protein
MEGKEVRMSSTSAARLALVSCAMFLLSSSAARAGPVRIVSQDRFVDAVAEEPGPRRQHQHQDASDFGPFNQTVQVTTPGAAGIASQDSVLLLTPQGALFTATATVIGSTRIPVGGESMFGVTFDVSQPLPYRLSFVGHAQTGVPPPAFTFSGPFGGGPLPGPQENLSGVLAPGSYHFTADTASPNSSFNVNFSVGTAVPLPSPVRAIIATIPMLFLAARASGIVRAPRLAASLIH